MKIKRLIISPVLTADEIASQIQYLLDSGLCVFNPQNRQIIGFSADGDRVDFDQHISLHEVFKRCTGIQLWFDAARDVYLSWGNDEQAFIAYLEGLSELEAKKIATSIGNFALLNSIALGKPTIISTLTD
jgi:hypothetical protein